MSVFIPYSPTQVIDYLINLFNLDFSDLTAYESTIITLFANLYFFIFWGIIIYFSLKIFNRIWERFF